MNAFFVNGVYTADPRQTTLFPNNPFSPYVATPFLPYVNKLMRFLDPRRVPEAFPIESLKFDEAIELAAWTLVRQKNTLIC